MVQYIPVALQYEDCRGKLTKTWGLGGLFKFRSKEFNVNLKFLLIL